MGNRRTALLSALFAACEAPLPKRPEVVILNGTGNGELCLRADAEWTAQGTWYDHRLQEIATRRQRICDGLRVEIPIGGSLLLKRL